MTIGRRRIDRRNFAKVSMMAALGVATPLTAATEAEARPCGHNPLRNTLLADGPHPDLQSELMLYGQFVGTWDLVMTDHGTGAVSLTEVTFGWILRGYGVADVWTTRGSETELGTTIRIYQPDEKRWRITWNPANDPMCVMATGQQVGDEIVQPVDYNAAGFPITWVFSEITPTSFEWRAQSPGGNVYVSAQATRRFQAGGRAPGSSGDRQDRP